MILSKTNTAQRFATSGGGHSKPAFTLAEMMVVLLIMTIILAAMAPVMTTRMKNEKAALTNNSSPWIWVSGKDNYDAYLKGNLDNTRAMIGQKEVPATSTNENARLIINTSNAIPNHILFKNGEDISGKLQMANSAITLGSDTRSINTSSNDGNIAIGNGACKNISSGQYNICMGELTGNTSSDAQTDYAASIGYTAQARTKYSTAIGYAANAYGGSNAPVGTPPDNFGNYNDWLSYGAIAIGVSSQAYGQGAVAVGAASYASGNRAGAIGPGASVQGNNSFGIGPSARVKGDNSIFLGYCTGTNQNAFCDNANSITIGQKITDTYIHLGLASYTKEVNVHSDLRVDGKIYGTLANSSDRRLKYVGKENTSGLDKIKQLKVFNYTFKKDKTKTPHVGVIAQDLQKIFPHAVSKGADGFLTIRMEDMFYAVINAIKELDAKLRKHDSELLQLRKENQELKKRLEILESKIK